MKKTIVLLALVTWAGTVLAQETTDQKNPQKTQRQKTKSANEDDYLVFNKGKLYEVKKQLRTEVKAPITLDNGTVVKENGSYRTADGKEHQLKNGEYLDRKGNHYSSKARFKQHHKTVSTDTSSRKIP